MAYNYHVPKDSLQERYIERIVAEQHITPEEAISQALDEGLKWNLTGKKTPAEAMVGAFSSEEDSVVLDEAMNQLQIMRQRDRLRDCGQ